MATELPEADRVRETLAEIDGRDPGELTLRPIPGGASRQVFVVEGDGGRWVLRRDPPGAESFVPLEVEFRVIEAALEAAVPAPRPLRFEPAAGPFGSAGFLMEFVEGESVPPRILRRDAYADARERLPGQLAEALARVHAIEPGSIEGLPRADGDDPALAACGFWERELDRIGEPLPTVELGLRWLRANAPPPAAEALVHGDFRLGNFLAATDGLAAVLDWELCHSGDPAEDIGWLCVRAWRFGADEQPVAGLSSLDEFLDAYERAGGSRPDAGRLRWWEALGNVKWAVICAGQAHDHLIGRRRSVELASLGRRICEPEWDLLELINAEGA
jgi:aminoglycoside phosphotransferase (APT) family kinase protein